MSDYLHDPTCPECVNMTHIDRARLLRLGIDPAQVTVEGVACEWCGTAIVERFGSLWGRAKGGVGQYQCESNPNGLHDPGSVDHGDGLRVRVEELEARMAKVLGLRARPDGLKSAWGRGYEDALADVRATLRGDL